MDSWCLDCREAGGPCETHQVARLVAELEARTGRRVAIRSYAGLLRLVQQEAARRAVVGTGNGRLPRGHREGRLRPTAAAQKAFEAAMAGPSAGDAMGRDV